MNFIKRKINRYIIKILIITEFLIGSASTISSSTKGLINPGAGMNVSSSTALLTSIAILKTNEHISNLKPRCTRLRDWNIVITLLYKKTLKTFMVDEKMITKGL